MCGKEGIGLSCAGAQTRIFSSGQKELAGECVVTFKGIYFTSVSHSRSSFFKMGQQEGILTDETY